MSDNLQPQPHKAWQFLAAISPGQNMHIETMASEGPASPKVRTFTPANQDGFETFIEQANRDGLRRNVYFLPNAEFLSATRSKANIAKARFLHVDLDAKDYPGEFKQVMDKIIGLLLDDKGRPKGIPMPSAAWFTGGGAQAVWRLSEPLDSKTAEMLNKKLLIALSGDPSTHDVSRLLRLPGTINWLNDKKRDAGRQPELSFVYHPADTGKPIAEYTADDFDLGRVKITEAGSLGNGAEIVELEIGEPKPLPDDLAEIIPNDPRWMQAIITGKNPAHKDYPSRSELLIAAVVWMLGKKVEPEYILSILLEPRLGISASVLENDKSPTYAKRQIKRADAMLQAVQKDWPKPGKNGPYSDLAENVRHAFALTSASARHNRFSMEDEIDGPGFEDRDVKDIADILCSKFEREHDFRAKTQTICRELTALAHENSYHPIQDYLNALEWDGTERLDRWLIDYCQAEDIELNREFGAKTLLGAVARIFEPGSKFDTILVLESGQGKKKSSLVAALAPDGNWVSEGLSFRMDDKAKAEILRRAWIVELPELDGMTKVTIQELKSFLSITSDTYRAAYAKNAQRFKRHCIIIGTTNDETYLRDPTGNRRFWPVTVGTCDVDGFVASRDQIWAEAVYRYRKGEALTLSKHLWSVAEKVQNNRVFDDPFEDVLAMEFGNKEGRVQREYVFRLLNLDPSKRHVYQSRSIRDVMAKMGWREGSHRFKTTGSSAKGYIKGEKDASKTEWVIEPNSRIPELTCGWPVDENVPF